jgi:hypothetical protein
MIPIEAIAEEAQATAVTKDKINLFISFLVS